ncbi:hypothetical protein [Rathayibacter tanaceti]|uniref:Uncharacterized protein n=2 Tax=Rathayibacter tanaceti TaxID=1671680 RepID=A0A162F948_9MICO|nr:hypothetical protein [Rathayibacter tanaceti]KZX20733.1 hypothetical protein ACH61_02160 [Rathayibacter tanaceti]QHC54687.1 hypothetical protein GSU10_02815 [Rathayibacter tanaceti]TCO37502.1 hypothetical protein EV639_104171 [Rathayibacter tanaceti]
MTSPLQDSSWIWFALAIVTAGLAEQKGRSRWRWFVLGLFLGPLATALVVMWARPESGVSTDVRWNFAIGSGLAAIAFLVVAASSGVWLLAVLAALAALAAGLLAWLSRRVPYERLRH